MIVRAFTTENNEAIAKAFRLIPTRFHKYLECDWLLSKDPNMAGVHSYRDTDDDRLYSTEAHVAYPFHRLDSVDPPAIVILPTEKTPAVVVHELGHVLDWGVGWYNEYVEPVTEYAETNQYEAFAEAFTAYCVPGYINGPIDERTLEFFERLR